MATKRKINVIIHSRLGTVCSLLLALSLPVVLGSGCQSHPDFVSIPAPVTEPAVAPATQSQLEGQVGQYVAYIQAGNASKAESLMSPAFRSSKPSSALELAMHSSYLPFLGSSKWKYDMVNSLHKGKTIVVHAAFVGVNKHPYRVNFIFAKADTIWLIDAIAGPSVQGPASIRTSSGGAASKAK